MAIRRFLQLDVFADRPGAGNPLAVVVDSDGLDDAAMAAFARWTNLSETIFLFPPQDDGADYRVRIFTPVTELPFAGHPSVGAAWAALDSGLARNRNGHIVQQCAAGLLPVLIGDEGRQHRIQVRSPRARFLTDLAAPTWLRQDTVFGMHREGIDPQLWNNGPDWWLLELASESSVRTLQPDLAMITSLPGSGDAPGGKLAVFACGDGDSPHPLVVRAFAPGGGVPEDPVTGSANACIAAALLRHDRLPGGRREYHASQGREVGRDGVVEIRIDDEDEVWIGGQVQAVIRGELDWG